ncbi:YDC1 [Malassezia furfur]|nr:YDC1 [Malassezia furfur]
MSWLKERDPIPVGYWGPVKNSRCLSDRSAWTKYIAEPVNTLTNLLFFAAAIYGMYRLGTVGFGSFLFHMTLKHEAQMMDELPMIWASCYVCWCLLDDTVSYGNKKHPAFFRTLITGLAVFITVTYVMHGNPVFHQVAYACIFAFTSIHGLKILWSKDSPLSLTPAARVWQATARHQQVVGIVSFLTGFLIWNIDNIFCGTLRVSREIVGYPWALLLEGHGWWHILTCYGAYLLTVSCQIIVLPLREHPDNFVFVNSFLPYIKRVRDDDPKHRFVDEYRARKTQ